MVVSGINIISRYFWSFHHAVVSGLLTMEINLLDKYERYGCYELDESCYKLEQIEVKKCRLGKYKLGWNMQKWSCFEAYLPGYVSRKCVRIVQAPT